MRNYDKEVIKSKDEIWQNCNIFCFIVPFLTFLFKLVIASAQ